MNRGSLSATFRLAGMAGRFALLLVIGRWMTPEDLGAFGLFAVTVAVLSQLVGLELHQPATREFLRREKQDRENLLRAQLHAYTFAYLALPPVIALACFAGIVSVAHAFGLAIVIVGSHLSLEAHRLLTACGEADSGFLVSSVAQGLWVFPLAAAMLLAPATRTLNFVFATWAAATAIAAFIGYRRLRRLGVLARSPGTGPDLGFLRKAWPSALTFMASTTAFVLIETIDRYFLNHFHGEGAVGVYTLYAGIARVLREVAFAAVVSGSLPLLVASGARGEAASAIDTFGRMSRRLASFTLLGTPLLGAGLFALLPFVGNGSYEDAVVAYFILLASTALGTIALAPHYLLYALGRERTILKIHLSTLLAASIGNWLLVPKYGVLGAAVASLISSTLLLASRWIAADRSTDAIKSERGRRTT